MTFGTVEECRRVLGSSDDFTRAMSAFDRAVRTRKSGATEADVLAHAAAECRDWSTRDLERWHRSAGELNRALEGLPGLVLPTQVTVFVTTGAEEFEAAYTRGASIILSSRELSSPVTELFAHELFHVASRHSPKLRDAVYPLFGFQRLATPFAYPKELEETRLTNPDAFHNDHAASVDAEGTEIFAVPVLQAQVPLHEAMGMRISTFAAVMLVDGSVPPGNAPGVHSVESTDYLSRVAINTEYVIHPEEVAADNFSLLIQSKLGRLDRVPVRRVLEALDTLLAVPPDAHPRGSR